MPLDKPEAKMVEARFNEKPFIVAFGVAKKRDVKGAGGVGTDGIKGEIQSQKDLDWRVLYNLKALPEGFMPQERLGGFNGFSSIWKHWRFQCRH